MDVGFGIVLVVGVIYLLFRASEMAAITKFDYELMKASEEADRQHEKERAESPYRETLVPGELPSHVAGTTWFNF